MGQVEAGSLDELALGANALEKQDELELEEDDRVDRGAAAVGVAFCDPVADEAQVTSVFKVAGDVLGWNEVFQRDGNGVIEWRGLGGPSMVHSHTGATRSSPRVYRSPGCRVALYSTGWDVIGTDQDGVAGRRCRWIGGQGTEP